MRRSSTTRGIIGGVCLLVFIFSNGLAPADTKLKIVPQAEDAELSVAVDAAPDTVVVGSNITYTITVTNEGPGIASGVTVADSLPDETTFVSCTATGSGVCGGDGNNRTVTFGSIAPDTSETVTLVASVICPLNDGTEIDNTASIRSATSDSIADEEENETVFVAVAHPPPSIIWVSVKPTEMWPANHKMNDVIVDYQVSSSCGPVTTKLSITSNEPINGTGDGDTFPDWEINDQHHVRLRAERSGNGNGRTYTITVTATDIVNQSTSRAVLVNVPKSQKSKS
jgi:uncharacterized repeat protein (TIGR01451 family)